MFRQSTIRNVSLTRKRSPMARPRIRFCPKGHDKDAPGGSHWFQVRTLKGTITWQRRCVKCRDGEKNMFRTCSIHGGDMILQYIPWGQSQENSLMVPIWVCPIEDCVQMRPCKSARKVRESSLMDYQILKRKIVHDPVTEPTDSPRPGQLELFNEEIDRGHRDDG